MNSIRILHTDSISHRIVFISLKRNIIDYLKIKKKLFKHCLIYLKRKACEYISVVAYRSLNAQICDYRSLNVQISSN